MDLFDLYASLTIDTSDYESALRRASQETQDFATRMQAGLNAVGAAGGSGTLTGGLLQAGALVSAFGSQWSAAMTQAQQSASGLGGILLGLGTAVSGMWATVSASTAAGTASMTGSFGSLRAVVTAVFPAISGTIQGQMSAAATAAVSGVARISTAFTQRLPMISTAVASTFSSLESTVTARMNHAVSAVQTAVGAMRGAMNFTWSLPYLKVPHVSISGAFSLDPPSAPRFSVSWYKKAMENAMVLDGATIFGAAGGSLLGGGEAGREVVSGEAHLMDLIRQASGGGSEEILSLLRRILERLEGGRSLELVTPDGDALARWIYPALSGYARSTGQPMTAPAR